MTNPEYEFALMLRKKIEKRRIDYFDFEPVRLRIGSGCWYTPDFLTFSFVTLEIKFYEVKGPYIRPDSLVKFKVAKEKIRWAYFELWQRSKTGIWTQLL